MAMHLSEINIFPVKSLGGISLSEANVEERGLQFDRRWMLIDENRKFMTQRELAKMAVISVEIDEDELVFTAENFQDLRTTLRPDEELTATVAIWSSKVKAKIYPAEINDWFSDVLGQNCRLVQMPEETKRKVSPFYAVRKFVDTVSFADAYPFMLLSEASLEDLNSKLEKPLPMNRFRPNLVVAGSEPFAEDSWKQIRIGETVFHIVKPCARCVMTTIDQQLGEKDGKEPLKTLASYRTKNSKVLFGQNLIAEKAGGIVKVGDAVEIVL